jgi:hypothetical protein
VRVTVREVDHDGGTSFDATTGEIEFEIETPDAAKGNAGDVEDAEEPSDKTVTIRGKVVDDATGAPIGRLITQAGKFDPANPTQVTWGYSEGRSSARDEWTTTYASQTAAADGTFLTERIARGRYVLVAEAYTPLSPEQRFGGLPRPSHRAQIVIDVPADGELAVPDLALKPVAAGE